jgi:hypothetical protein
MRVARAAFPKGNLYLKIPDEIGVFYSDADFADFFPTREQPAFSPWRLALITVMRFVKGLPIEDAHLTETDRVSRLLALLAIAFCWAMVLGEFVCRQKPLKRKKPGRFEKSIFRAGLDT